MADKGHPINILTHRKRDAEKRAAMLDAWTRDPANDGHEEWDWNYREMRRERARARRLARCILRMDRYLRGERDFYQAAMARIEGPSLYGR